jgi:UDP-glucose 4-epimerase
MTTILITGCAGLLGSRLADWIVEKHPEVMVVGVDDLSGGFIENVNDNVRFYPGDVAKHELDKLFELYRPEVVYHFAAYAAECLSPFIRTFNYNNNLIATANIVNCCIRHKVKRLVFTSSMAVYGHAKPPFSEGMKPSPVDPYGVAKYACEMDIRIAGEQHGLDWCIIRPHNVYGAKQNLWDSYRNAIGIFMYKMRIGDPITIFGDGLQRRAFSYIDDSLEPLWKAGHDPRASHQIINLGGIRDYTILEAAESVMLAARNLKLDIPAALPIKYLPPRNEVREAFSTHQKSVDLLDFEHTTDLDSGVTQMWQWAIKQPKRERFIWPAYEINDGLYSYWKPEALKDGHWKESE